MYMSTYSIDPSVTGTSSCSTSVAYSGAWVGKCIETGAETELVNKDQPKGFEIMGPFGPRLLERICCAVAKAASESGSKDQNNQLANHGTLQRLTFPAVCLQMHAHVCEEWISISTFQRLTGKFNDV